MRRALSIACIFAAYSACSPADNSELTPDMGEEVDIDFEPGCEGGLVAIDGECELVTNALEVLLFRNGDEPSAQTCTRTYTSDDPGIDEALIAEEGRCRVFDTELYGPLNYEPAPREPTVTVARGGESIQIDEAEIFESCVERRTIPDGFFADGEEFTVSFDGNDVIPGFAASITVPQDPGFARSALREGEPVVFSWTPTPADEVLVLLSEGSINVVCQTSPQAGELAVPASLVELLPEPEAPRTEVFTSIRLRNTSARLFESEDAVASLTADTYQSSFAE